MLGEEFIAALHEAVAEVGRKHGLDVPEFPVFEFRGVIKANPSFYPGRADEYFSQCYREHAQAMGLDPHWLGQTFSGPESGKPLTLIGMDPDGGAHCLRMKDEAGRISHVQPEALKSLS